jgi:uncharacterized protein with HEPN domain
LDEVDLDLVWKVIKVHVPSLISDLDRIKAQESKA